MRLDIAEDDIGAGGARRARCFQHRVGLADASRRAEEDPQPAAMRPGLFGLHVYQQLIGIRPLFGHGLVRLRGLRIEREIQFQHIHARLAQQPEGAPFGRMPRPARRTRAGSSPRSRATRLT